MRERGLKLSKLVDQREYTMSLPMRERGLKRPPSAHRPDVAQSLPMRERGLKHNVVFRPPSAHRVAPHAGAWIETLHYHFPILGEVVAPHAGAWIETLIRVHFFQELQSLPMRERGLKLPYGFRGQEDKRSLPMRERGLKLFDCSAELLHCKVAPHAGAWIETSGKPSTMRVKLVAPHAGAWIETFIRMCENYPYVGRSPCGSVD